MTLPVHIRVINDCHSPIGTPRYRRRHPQLRNPLPQPPGIVSLVRNHILAGAAGQRRFGLGNVVLLASRQDKTQRIAQPVHCDLYFGAEPAPTAPRCLGVPAAPLFRGAGGVGMGANDGAVNDEAFGVRVIVQMLVEGGPDASVALGGIAFVDGVPLAVFRGQGTPRRAGAGDPKYGSNETAAIGFTATVEVGAGVALFIAVIVEVTGRMVLLIPKAWNKATDIGWAEGLTEGRAENGTGYRPYVSVCATRQPGSLSWTRMPGNACATAPARMRAGCLPFGVVWLAVHLAGESRSPLGARAWIPACAGMTERQTT